MSKVPPPRQHHMSASVGNKVYMFGGVGQKMLEEKHSSICDTLLGLDKVEIFDMLEEIWQTETAGGDYPPALCDASCATLGNCIYVYGGTEASPSPRRHDYLNCFYRLDTSSMHWTRLPDSPIEGYARIIAYEDKIFAYGGLDEDSHVFRNELYCFKGKCVIIVTPYTLFAKSSAVGVMTMYDYAYNYIPQNNFG